GGDVRSARTAHGAGGDRLRRSRHVVLLGGARAARRRRRWRRVDARAVVLPPRRRRLRAHRRPRVPAVPRRRQGQPPQRPPALQGRGARQGGRGPGQARPLPRRGAGHGAGGDERAGDDHQQRQRGEHPQAAGQRPARRVRRLRGLRRGRTAVEARFRPLRLRRRRPGRAPRAYGHGQRPSLGHPRRPQGRPRHRVVQPHRRCHAGAVRAGRCHRSQPARGGGTALGPQRRRL
ncbi:MAG: hypothetical protein AVDCRST_MAG10-1114, partial [uncultured Acidimicrobiales bacterium]